MIKILKKVMPKQKFGIAISGGVDSVVFSHFLKQGKKDFDLYFFNHGDDSDKKALEFLNDYSKFLDVQLITNDVITPINKSENDWRNARYKWLESFDVPIITGHNLQDVVSGYVLFWLKGQEKLLPVIRNNIFRPFLMTSKDDIYKYALKNNLVWYEEIYNSDLTYDRNYINISLLPHIYHLNPGFDKMVIRKLKRKLHKQGYY